MGTRWVRSRTTPSLCLSPSWETTSNPFSFMFCTPPTAPLVLGCPWLDLHDPHVSWSSGWILGWSEACHANCLHSAPLSARWDQTHDLTGVPSVYHDLAPVFCKESALSLPPHRPYDCAINLLPGAPLPVGRLYNLSVPEKEVMRSYILASGIIRPSSSPVAAGFFLCVQEGWQP